MRNSRQLMAETVSRRTAIMSITRRFLPYPPPPPHPRARRPPTLTHKQLIQCNLAHSHTYLKWARMNTPVIKSHSNDGMKTVRRQRRRRGGNRGGGGARNGIGSHASTTELRLRHKLLLTSIPAACRNYLPLQEIPPC